MRERSKSLVICSSNLSCNQGEWEAVLDHLLVRGGVGGGRRKEGMQKEG